MMLCAVTPLLFFMPPCRLYLLLAAVPGLAAVAEYSSHVAPEAQAAALSGFKQGRTQVLVTSDAMARGMDVSGISAVINYDPPTYPKTYVHRAGRTARAGSTGAVYSLLKPEDVVHFNNMVRKMQGAKLQQVKLSRSELQQLRPGLKAALQHVQELVALEQRQGLNVQGGQAGASEQQQQQALNKRSNPGDGGQLLQQSNKR
jgi:ATP-dependent RNA helicase DDX51/DBP6